MTDMNVHEIMQEIKANMKRLPEPSILDIRKQPPHIKAGMLRRIARKLKYYCSHGF